MIAVSIGEPTAPGNLSGEPEALAVAPGDDGRAEAVRRAQLQADEAGSDLGVAEDARPGARRRRSCAIGVRETATYEYFSSS